MKEMYRSEREKLEAEMMKNPLGFEKAYAYFGLLLGIFPPLVIFCKILFNTGGSRNDGFIFLLFGFVNLITACVGYFSGKFIGYNMRSLEKTSWSKMILTSPFLGLIWGILAGGAGGVFIFIFGAFIGAFIGGLVGAIAITFFAIFHRLLKKGEMIETKHFLPLAFGTVFTICSFILGL